MPNHRKYHKFDPIHLHELYWGQWLPTTEIGRMFNMPPRSVLGQLIWSNHGNRFHSADGVADG